MPLDPGLHPRPQVATDGLPVEPLRQLPKIGQGLPVDSALARVVGGGLLQVLASALHQRLEVLHPGQVGSLCHDPCQGSFPGPQPLIDQLRVIDQERRHAQSRGVADPEVALQGDVQPDRPLRIACPGHVFDLLDAEMPQQVHGKHLRAEGLREVGIALQATEVGDAELAVAIHGGGAIQVAHLGELPRVWLTAFGQRPEKTLEVAQAAVGARQHQHPGIEAPGFLQGHVAPQIGQLLLIDITGEQDEADVPLIGDHPVAAFFRRQVIRENHAVIVRTGGVDAVDGGAKAFGIQVEAGALDAPLLIHHAPHAAAHETQPALKVTAQPIQVHDLRRGAQGRLFGSIGTGG